MALLARSGGQIAALATGIGARALALDCDMADAASVDRAMADVLRWAGRIDVLINNAGVIDPIARLADAPPAEFAQAVAINLEGVFHGMRAVIPQMRARGRGTIITPSRRVRRITRWRAGGAYCASKAGAAMLTRVAHLEEARGGCASWACRPGRSRPTCSGASAPAA